MESSLSNTVETEESNLDGEYSGDGTDELQPDESYQETNGRKRVSTPSRELQEAKKKLEELRLLRFEEKSFLKQEIEQLNEKYGEGERNSSNMERQLKKYNADKIALDEKVSSLEKELSIGAQINTMQEQEIVRLEMKLKDEEIQRYEVSKQLELVRRAILEKEQIRMKDVNQLLELRERISELDESNTYYKTTVEEGEKTMWDIEQVNQGLKAKVSWLTAQLEEEKLKAEKLCVDVKEAEVKITQLEEKEGEAQQNLSQSRVNLESQVTKYGTLQEEHLKEVTNVQQELDNVTVSEQKYKDKIEQTEHLFHESLREKDGKILELQRIVDRVPTLEEQIRDLERQNTETELRLNELREVVGKHIRRRDKVEETGEEEVSRLIPTKLSPGRSSSPVKGKVEDSITCEEIDEYFEEADISVRLLNEQIRTLSEKVEQEEAMVVALNTTIESLRSELEKTQSNLTCAQEQYRQATETIKVHEQNNESKTKENEHLRGVIKDCEGQIDHLKTQISSVLEEMQKNNETREKEIQEKVVSIERQSKEAQILRETIEDYKRQVDRLKANAEAHKEEEGRLQLIVQGLENDIKNVQGEKIDEEQKFEEKAKSLNEIIEKRNKEISELQSEMKTLVEGNETLEERLTHLESYSEKLSEMLERDQAADDKAREKFANEINEYKQMVTDKDAEVIELSSKIDELSASVREKCDYQEQIDKKLKELAASQKKVVEENEQIRKEKGELEAKLETSSEAHSPAQSSEENEALQKRCNEQVIIIEDLDNRINLLETEKNSLNQSISTLESDIQLKESLIAQLSQKPGETGESISSLKSSIQKGEADKKHFQNKLNISRHEKQMMEKTIREQDDETSSLRCQVANLQRLLAKAEDAREMSLGNAAHYQSQLESLRTIQEKSTMKDLEGHIQSLRVELNLERLCRERLEARYTKRHEEVNKLRSTFDQSLNTISKDTKNIENIIGKSLQKIDGIENKEVADSDFVDSDGESLAVSAKVSVDNKYLSLPERPNKSFDSSLGELTVGTHTSSSTPRKSPKRVDAKSPPNSAPKRITTRSSPAKEWSYIQEAPVRDEVKNYRKAKGLLR